MGATREVQKVVTTCPACGARISLRGKAEEGRRLVCLHCGEELTVVQAEPVELRKAHRE